MVENMARAHALGSRRDAFAAQAALMGGSMDQLDIARWQFGITTVYHFLMVPLTLGLGPLVAWFQLKWVRTDDERYLRLTKFWGKIYLINFIMGVATGIVQEFQFGMAWSEYSRYVGDVFGAPLAMEALLAFFIESTFLGLWIFGWGRLPKRAHLAVLWAAVIGSIVSAYFIIVANSWMQHPVGIEVVDGRPRMNDAWAVFTNNTALIAFPHVIAGSFAVGAAVLIGLSWYHLWRRRVDGIDTIGDDGKVVPGHSESIPGRDAIDYSVWWTALRTGIVVSLIAGIAVVLTGDQQGKLMFKQQPLKMASAEAACDSGTELSLLTLGNPASNSCDDVRTLVAIPGLLSFLAHGDFDTPVLGVNQLVPIYEERFGTNLPDDPRLGERAGQEISYVPLMWVTYWGFRAMIGFGAISVFGALLAWGLTRKRGTVPTAKWLMGLAAAAILLPFAANISGWVFTEMGRQPFVVVPNPTGLNDVYMFTATAVSPGVAGGEILFSLITLTAIYGILAVVETALIVKFTRGGVPSAMPELLHREPTGDEQKKADDVLAFAY
jgi:cytochrome d ubiquinol oxidase subunit I